MYASVCLAVDYFRAQHMIRHRAGYKNPPKKQTNTLELWITKAGREDSIFHSTGQTTGP